MEYKILYGKRLEGLEIQVNELLETGFVPCSSLFNYVDQDFGCCVVQAMLKPTWGAGNAPKAIKQRG